MSDLSPAELREMLLKLIEAQEPSAELERLAGELGEAESLTEIIGLGESIAATIEGLDAERLNELTSRLVSLLGDAG